MPWGLHLQGFISIRAGGWNFPFCPKPHGPMTSLALLARWGGHGSAPQLTHIWVMLVLHWKAFTSREPRVAETCGGGNGKALGRG